MLQVSGNARKIMCHGFGEAPDYRLSTPVRCSYIDGVIFVVRIRNRAT